ncbi:hypothetical protein JX265_007105 [Neoarthrinium moseri]|uniref:PLD phosphodiesterase domain-containing protein n=1 Tax=Neoarthrinium moseri TaxID=1658444 RepID=A0A9P9WKK2_9PEZI|nr:hypothetical protein JX265_007105 [Neoarthrinium moseri]
MADGGYESDDEDLRRAIALSLGHPDPVEGNRAIELSSDEEIDLDETPVRELETKGDAQMRKIQPNPKASPPAVAEQQQKPGSGPMGLAGLNRQQMEQERLARLAGKRKAPDSEQVPQGRERIPRTGAAPQFSGTEATRKDGLGRQSVPPNVPTAPDIKPSNSNGLRFGKGVVKKTWAYGYPRTEEDIKIEEILQKSELEFAVLSSFQWDEEWLLSKINIAKTKLVLVAFASSKQQQEEMKANVPGKSIRFCFPPMLPMGSMHSKLQLLRFPNYMRIVVPSGNLVSYDWGETGVMENMVFIIDLPKIEDPEAQAANKLTLFGEELAFFLRAQGLDDGLIKSLEKYDFSETSRYAFIHSIGQSQTDDDWRRTGYCGLGRAVSALGLGSAEPIEVDYIASSLGSINSELIAAMYYAAQGDDGLKVYGERSSKGAKRADSVESKLYDRFRIYFPSHETVAQSRGGSQVSRPQLRSSPFPALTCRESAGTICAQTKWWDSDKFPRQLVHDCKNVRPGLLMHSKMMFVQARPSQKYSAAWGYIGSANVSESAWGRLTRDKQSGKPKLTCRNWECGVLIPVSVGGRERRVADGASSSDLSVFLGSIPVPISWPATGPPEISTNYTGIRDARLPSFARARLVDVLGIRARNVVAAGPSTLGPWPACCPLAVPFESDDT